MKIVAGIAGGAMLAMVSTAMLPEAFKGAAWQRWSSSDWIMKPTIGENKSHVPNHQPDIYMGCVWK